MERREHYDPEDIESLLAERSYDELLEEERAYVLRHLSGRSEYEAMRSLLLDMRHDERNRTPLVPDEQVRGAVMEAFRQQRTPQWRIWLNSIGTALLPDRSLANVGWFERSWRPALALASIAVLVVVGVKLVSKADELTAPSQVAELKKEAEAAPTQQPAKEALKDEASAMREEQNATEQLQQKTVNTEQAAAASEAQVAADESVALSEPPPPVEEPAVFDAPAATSTGSTTERRRELAEMAKENMADSVESLSHVVTVNELQMNASTANATGKVRAIAAKAKFEKKQVSNSLADSPELLALLSAGW